MSEAQATNNSSQSEAENDELFWEKFMEELEKSDYDFKVISCSPHRRGIVFTVYLNFINPYFPPRKGKLLVYWNESLPFILIISPWVFPELGQSFEVCGEATTKHLKEYIDSSKKLTSLVRISTLLRYDRRFKELLISLKRISKQVRRLEAEKRRLLRTKTLLESL